MNEGLYYSLEALRAKAKFYGKKAMVYVEGPDDVVFWDPYFERTEFEIEAVGGCSNLDSFIEILENGELFFIVACDSDYRKFTNKKYNSPLIIMTFGHSIENMMYCPYKLSEVVRKLSKTNIDSLEQIESWYNQFVHTAHPLLVREIVNTLYNPDEDKVKVFGDTCARFCDQNRLFELDKQLICQFCEDNKTYFPEEEVEKAEKKIAELTCEERQLIKGHFYTNAIRNLLMHIVKQITKRKLSISEYELYSLTVHCDSCRIKQCVEKEFLQTQVTKAISYI